MMLNTNQTETKQRFCDRYCKCAWCCYVACLFAPVAALLIVLGWGLIMLIA